MVISNTGSGMTTFFLEIQCKDLLLTFKKGITERLFLLSFDRKSYGELTLVLHFLLISITNHQVRYRKPEINS